MMKKIASKLWDCFTMINGCAALVTIGMLHAMLAGSVFGLMVEGHFDPFFLVYYALVFIVIGNLIWLSWEDFK